MGFQESFADIIQTNAPLAPHTLLRIGGQAEMILTPRSVSEMASIVATAAREKIPLRVLGDGSKLLIRDEGISGAVLRLRDPLFRQIRVEGKTVRVGSGARLVDLIQETTTRELAGFETLVGISGTLGGALKCNSGDRWGEIADFVRRVEVLDDQGQILHRDRADLHFGDHTSDIEDPVILSVEFELDKDATEAIVRRMRKAWIQRMGQLPHSFQSAIRVFKHPRSMMANTLIEKAGMAQAKFGAAEISDRNANWIVAQPGTTAKDILQLTEMIQNRVREKCGVALEREMIVW